MRCVFCVVFAVLGLFSGSSQTAKVPAVKSHGIVLASGPEGCVAAPSQTCSYVATQVGRYVAAGSGWGVEVNRAGREIYYGPDNGPTAGYVIVAGDVVTASAGTGVVRIGPSPENSW